MNKLEAHANNIALHNLIFSLPFAYTSAILAADGQLLWGTLLWITLAIFGARSAAMSLNNLLDLRYDSKQERLAHRALVSGSLSPKEALAVIVFSLLIFAGAVSQLPPLCFKLLPVAICPFLIYPYLKRFTWHCHAGLGLAIAMAPAGAWVAVREEISLPLVLLCTAVGLWIGAFDATYSCQDEAFDRSEGLHSLATRFGARGALRLTRTAHAICVGCFCGVGFLLHLHWPYFVGVFIAALTLIYQHSIVHVNDYHRVTKAFFLRNGIVSLAMCFFTWMSFHMK